MRVPRPLVLACVALSLLSGCTAQSVVDMTVRSSSSADVVVSLTLTDEAAAVVAGDPDVLQELKGAFSDRTGVEPTVSASTAKVVVSTAVDYSQLTDAGALTGVGQVRLSGHDRDVQASVELRDAPDLVAALTSSLASQPDATAVTATALQSTQLVLSVHFPGGLDGKPSVTGISQDAVSVDSSSVTVSRSAAQAGAGALIVTGDPQAPPAWGWVAAGGAAAVLACVGVLAWRRDQRERAAQRDRAGLS